MELRRLGAIPRYSGPTPDDSRVRGLPHNKSGQDFIIQKLRGYATEEKMFVCAGEGSDRENLFFLPTVYYGCEEVTGMHSSCRQKIDSGARILDARRRTTERWSLPTSTLLLPDIVNYGLATPNVPIVGANRDIEAAFTRFRLHPDDAVMFGAEFELGPPPSDNIMFSISPSLSGLRVRRGYSVE